MNAGHRLSEVIKKFFEELGPDLRKHMKFELPGKVIAVRSEDRLTVDVRIDDVPVAGEAAGEPLFLPDVPVNALVAGDGWGMWATPEEGSEVKVAFRDGNITDPSISGSEYLNNRTPIGSRIGSFTIADKSGQRFVLRPDKGMVTIRSFNVDDETAGTRSERTGGARRIDVKGDSEVKVGGHSTRTTAGNLREFVDEGEITRACRNFQEFSDYTEEIGASIQFFQHALIVNGAARHKVAGRENYQVGGDRIKKILGDSYGAIAKGEQSLIGGRLRLIPLGLNSDGTLPTPDKLVCTEIGGPGMNVWGGIFVPGVSQPMVNGLSLAVNLAIWVNAVTAALSSAGFPIAAATAAFLTALFGSPTVPATPTQPILSARSYTAGL